MSIYHPPTPPVFTGGAQPYAPQHVNPAFEAVQVDDPPFSQRERTPTAAVIATLWQPNPWQYRFFGASGPFIPKTLSPGIPGQSVDAPPPRARDARNTASIIALNQPPLWPFVFVGGKQPYAQPPLSPGVPGQSIDNPPFSHREREASTAAIKARWQPDPWQYVFFGASQPFEPKKLSPGIPGQSVNEPPYDMRRGVTIGEIVALNQPPIWNYSFQGGLQPYAPTPLSPLIEGVPVPIPGAGKRKNFPSYIPQPAYEAKPNKPFRPVWDKPKQGEIEALPAPLPAGPPPLPPASLFGQVAAPPSPVNTAALPTFGHLVPPDPLAYAKHMQQVQDESDIEAVLRALGLIP